jgi:hypothetical protein
MSNRLSHTIDLHNPISQLPYLGMDIGVFLSIAADDNWTVSVLWENEALNSRGGTMTLEVKSDWVRCGESNGRVIWIA